MNKINFSYASDLEHNFAQRLIIKTIEKVTGKKKLEKLYNQYLDKISSPRTFWSDILEIMEISIVDKSINKIQIPKKGPLLVLANHPFGIIDGLILCSLVSKVRNDFKIMTHETLTFLPQLKDYILPVDFSGTDKKTIKTLLPIVSARNKNFQKCPAIKDKYKSVFDKKMTEKKKKKKKIIVKNSLSTLKNIKNIDKNINVVLPNDI